jgi:hypothetical protein
MLPVGSVSLAATGQSDRRVDIRVIRFRGETATSRSPCSGTPTSAAMRREGPLERGRLRPDFSFIDDAGEVILWKHLGRMDQAKYLEGWARKKNWYCATARQADLLQFARVDVR